MKIRKSLETLAIAAALLFSMNANIFAQENEEHGEESGKMYTKTQTYKMEKHGVKLVLKYDKAETAFIGTMVNVSKKTAEKARVEVHLSNGVELGPTKPVNLKPGKTAKVKLSAKGQKFEKWNTHAEIGSNEHGHGEGGEKGHSEREGGEHSSKKKEGKGEHEKKGK